MKGTMTSSKRKTFTIICIVFLCLFAAICAKAFGLLKPIAAEAQAMSENLHTQTKIMQKCNDAPAITVLTHGYGCEASVWSNDYNSPSPDDLAYNSESLIAAIGRQLGDNYDLYYMTGKFEDDNAVEEYDFTQYKLYKLDLHNYSIAEDKQVDHITTATKHIVLLFESGITTDTNQAVYEQFDYFLDTISMQYKELTGKLPRYNLVGHSRGGVTNIQYATEHPYNVAALFSMGTPYNGSTLGQIKPILEMLEMAEKINGEWIIADGAKDILNGAKSKELRDAWNAALAPDVEINAVVYGTMTSFDFAKKFLAETEKEIEEGKYDDHEGYKETIEEYKYMLNFAINFADSHPIATNLLLQGLDGLIEIVQQFGYGQLENVSEVLEEVQEILRLYNVINGEAVLMDNLYIDVNSQLGFGFSDGGSYNGFKRYVKILDEDDFGYNRAIPSEPAITHNLETMNADYVRSISKSLVYGKALADIPQVNDNSTGEIEINGSHALMFSSPASANRKITAHSATIRIYKIDENKRSRLCRDGVNELIFYFADSADYLLIFDGITQVTTYSFTVTDELNFFKNAISIAYQESKTFSFTPHYSGYYIVESSLADIEIKWKGINILNSNRYYIYLQKDSLETVTLKNKYLSDVDFSFYIRYPDDISLKEEKQVSSFDKVCAFTNLYTTEMEFQLKLSWESGINSATVYRSDNSIVGSYVTGTNQRTVYFTLASNEVCYIVYNIETSAKVKILPSQNQLRWEIDGKYMSNDITLERGKSYNVHLVVVDINRNEIGRVTEFSGFDKVGFRFSNNVLQITYEGRVGDEFIIIPIDYGEYPLRVVTKEGREDIKYAVTLDKTGGTGGTDMVEANYNRYMPEAAMPNRPGYRFLGYFADRFSSNKQYYDSNMQSVRIWDLETSATLYAHWEANTYWIIFHKNGGTGGQTENIPVTYGEFLPMIELPTLTGHNFLGYFDNEGKCYYEFFDPNYFDEDDYYRYYARICDFPYNIDLYAHWNPMTWRVGVWASLSDRGLTGMPDQAFSLSYDERKIYYVPGIKDYDTVRWTLTYTAGTIASGTETAIDMTNLCVGNYDSYTLTIYYQYNPQSECIAEGTMITLADGRCVPVELLQGNEMLLVWNMKTGRFESAPIMFIDKDKTQVYKVINLMFSDGTTVKVISEHGFWDFDLNRYVYLDEDAAQYIGHWFNKLTVNADGTYGWTRVQLIGVDVANESTTAYSPVTYGHLCYYVNGMLSMPGGIIGLFNIFEIDEQTMTINEEAFAGDIAEFGMFTYEEFYELYPISEEAFEAFNGKYLKVAIGKGLITYERIGELIERYSEFF